MFMVRFLKIYIALSMMRLMKILYHKFIQKCLRVCMKVINIFCFLNLFVCYKYVLQRKLGIRSSCNDSCTRLRSSPLCVSCNSTRLLQIACVSKDATYSIINQFSFHMFKLSAEAHLVHKNRQL